MCWARPLIGHLMPSWPLIGQWHQGDAPCTKLLSQVSSTGSRLITASCALGDIMSKEQSGDRTGRAEWQRRQYKVHHYWLLTPCCASFRFLSGLVVSDSFVLEYSARVSTCVSFVSPNQSPCRIKMCHHSHFYTQFKILISIWHCIHICGQTVESVQLRINFFNPSSFLATTL